MKEKDFIAYFKSKFKASSDNFDKRLFNNISGKTLPSFSQLRYLKEFIPRKEKIVLLISTVILAITSLAWLGVFVSNHLTASPKAGGEYSEALVGQPKFINPLFSSVNEVDSDLVALTYSGLFKFDKNQKLVPDLAREYSISPDQKQYTIKLRPGITWTDGEPFNADDVIYTFQTIQDVNVNSPLAASFQGITVKKDDDYTLEFILPEPFGHFLNSLTVGILPEHIWGDINPSSIKLAKNNLQPIGTGPWVFKSLTKDQNGIVQNVVLEKNEKYYGTAPYLDKLTMRFFETYDDAIDALRSHKVKALSFLPRQQEDKIPGKEFVIYQMQLPQYTAVFFNPFGNNLLKDKDLRMALTKAVDKKRILQDGLSGEGRIINTPELNSELEKYALDHQIAMNVDEANKLLDKKWKTIQPEEYFKIRKDKILKDQGIDQATTSSTSSTPQIAEIENQIRSEMNAEQSFYRKDKDGNILQLTITTADTPEYQKDGEVIASNWRTLGIKVNIEKVSSRDIASNTIKNRNYEVLLYAAIIGSDPDLYPFWHSSQIKYPGLNLAMFTNSQADDLLVKARGTADTEKQNEYYKKFQDILNTEVPAIFLYTPTYNFVASNEVKGINANKIFNPSDRYNGLNEWYVKTQKKWADKN